MNWINDLPERFSDKVQRLLNPAFNGSTLTVGELLKVLGRPTLLAIILVLAILVIVLDFIPGITYVLGLPLLWLSAQFAIGRLTPWLPGKLKHANVSTAKLAPVLSNGTKLFALLEKIARPRYTDFAESPYAFLTAFLMVALSAFIMLPIPFGDILPAIAIIFLALGQLEFDGALIAVGQILGLVTLGALTVVVLLMIGGFDLADQIIH